MIVSPEEYNGLLSSIEDPNTLIQYIPIPTDERIYNIDLNSRLLEGPDFLGSKDEHNAEIIWFCADRFFDDIDLFNSSCFIEYENAKKEVFYFASTIVVNEQITGPNKILVPWVVSNHVTRAPGVVKYSIRFAALTQNTSNAQLKQYRFVLNTRPTQSKVLDTLNFVHTDDETYLELTTKFSDRLMQLEDEYRTLSQDYNLYWLEV